MAFENFPCAWIDTNLLGQSGRSEACSCICGFYCPMEEKNNEEINRQR